MPSTTREEELEKDIQYLNCLISKCKNRVEVECLKEELAEYEAHLKKLREKDINENNK